MCYLQIIIKFIYLKIVKKKNYLFMRLIVIGLRCFRKIQRRKMKKANKELIGLTNKLLHE